MISFIKTSKDFLESVVNLPEKSMIFLDVDDTIIRPRSLTFSQKPYAHLIEDIKRNPKKHPNFKDIVSHWRMQRKVMLMDDEWPGIIDDLKQKYDVYGLTKMDTGQYGIIDSMEQWRYEELLSLGVTFQQEMNPQYKKVEDGLGIFMKDPLGHNENYQTSDEGSRLKVQEGLGRFLEEKEEVKENRKANFFKGIFFTGNYSKSQTVEKFLDLPQGCHVVLVDDLEESIKDMEEWCAKKGFVFHGYIFQGLEGWAQGPNPDVVALQKKYLIEQKRWLEDQEAEDLLKRSKKKG